MKECKYCGAELKDNQKFCRKCGKECIDDIIPDSIQDDVQSDYGNYSSENYVDSSNNGSVNNLSYKKNKKSKKKKIIAIIVSCLVVIAIATYLVFTLTTQSSLSAKCDELRVYTEKGVKLSDYNNKILDEAKESTESLNLFGLLKEKSKVEDLIKMANYYLKVDEALSDYKTNEESLNKKLEDKNIDLDTLNDYKPLEDSMGRLQAALDNNNVDEMAKELDAVKKDYDRYLEEVEKTLVKKAENLNDAKDALDTWENDYDEYGDEASREDVDADINVEYAKEDARSLMDEYKELLDNNDLVGANKLAESVIKQLSEYKNAINIAIKEKEEEEEADEYSYDEEDTDDKWAFEDIDTTPIKGNPFSGYGLTKKQEFLLCVIAKNEVFAKRGYVFGSELAGYFAKRSWYSPDKSVSDNEIMKNLKKENGTEYKNLKKLQKLIDKYAKNYSWAGKTVKQSKVSTEDFEDAIQAWYNV